MGSSLLYANQKKKKIILKEWFILDSSAADSLSQTVQLFQNLDMRYQVNVAGVKEQDLITQDLLHKLELESLDAVEMVKLAK